MADSAEEWESRLRARMDNLRNRLLDVEGCLKQDLDWILGIIDAAEEAAREAERERCAGIINALAHDELCEEDECICEVEAILAAIREEPPPGEDPPA